MPSGVLFIHNNFPGQFGDLAKQLQARGVPVAAVAQEHAPGLDGVYTAKYRLPRGSTPGIYDPATRAEADLIRAFGAYKAMEHLKEKGFDPQVIIAHAGWGETLYAHVVFPRAKQALFAEFFYHSQGFDVGFDNEFLAIDEERTIAIEAKGLSMSASYARADALVCPTVFQASTLPKLFQPLAHIIHEGIDVEAIRPRPPEPFVLDDGRVLPVGTPIITHVNNRMEPLRGLHIFARALPRLLAEIPDAHVIIIGQEQAQGYGGPPPSGKSWISASLEGVEDKLDPARTHFLGKVPHERMLAAMQASVAHVYYTYPFVLSWSLCEAMAMGCYVIGSDTPPLHDAITDGVDGKLLPFFDVDALSTALIEACRNPDASAAMREAARKTAVEKFSRERGRREWLELLKELGLKIPPRPVSPSRGPAASSRRPGGRRS